MLELNCIIKGLYCVVKQNEQEYRGKKLHIADERTFREAEKIISEELAYALGIEKDKVIDFLVSKLEK